MKKTLVLNASKKAYFFDRICNENIVIDEPFKNGKVPSLTMLRLFDKCNIRYGEIFYGEWYSELKQYDRIVLFDATCTIDPQLLKNIAKKAPNSMRYLYSWNIVSSRYDYNLKYETAQKFGYKIFSYDHGDCEKYEMNFNTIMYHKDLKIQSQKEKYDSFFLGYLKDRKDKIFELYKTIAQAGLNPHFVIVKKNKDDESDKLPFDFRTEYVDYYDYLGMLGQSKSILDIAQDGQTGYSMRVMEAIFFNKKLITTNKAILKSDFYNPNNILLIDLDNIYFDDIKSFFEKEFVPYNENIREYYSFESWVERFQ